MQNSISTVFYHCDLANSKDVEIAGGSLEGATKLVFKYTEGAGSVVSAITAGDTVEATLLFDETLIGEYFSLFE